MAEAYRIVEEGVASTEDVDAAFRFSLGPRLALWGPLLTEDLVVSKKTTASVWDYLYRNVGRENFRRPPTVDAFLEAGSLGAMTGQGWYRYARDYDSIISARDSQLKVLLNWLRQNDRLDEFQISPGSSTTKA